WSKTWTSSYLISNVVKTLAVARRRRGEGRGGNEGNVESSRGGFCDTLSVRKLSSEVCRSVKRFKISKSDSVFRCISASRYWVGKQLFRIKRITEVASAEALCDGLRCGGVLSYS
ncbi:MAG: hypothetical protein ACKESB_00310, partial [Candidatus Hodgkinia cicadicola]